MNRAICSGKFQMKGIDFKVLTEDEIADIHYASLEILEKTAPDKMSKAETYHNMGNSFMNEKQYDKAVAAYKNSMRNNSNEKLKNTEQCFKK